MAKKERVRRKKGGKEKTAKVVLLYFYNTHFADFGAFVRKKKKTFVWTKRSIWRENRRSLNRLEFCSLNKHWPWGKCLRDYLSCGLRWKNSPYLFIYLFIYFVQCQHLNLQSRDLLVKSEVSKATITVGESCLTLLWRPARSEKDAFFINSSSLDRFLAN